MLLANAFTNDARVYNEATSLIKAGHEVTIIAWDGERQSPERQDWDGIEVHRLRTRVLPGRHRIPFLATLNLLLWQRGAYRRALGLNKQKRLDVVHCHDLDTLFIGTRLKRKLGTPLIYDAHEIYGYMVAGSVPRLTVKLILLA